MKSWITTGLLAALMWGAGLAAAAQPALEALPEALEIELALSAAPEHWRAGATVYVLDPANGFRVAKEGDNGTACLVGRTQRQRPIYRDDLLIPVCFDSEGVATHLPRWFDVEALRAQGMSAPELHETIKRNYETGTYRAPTRTGFAPMLSPILIVFAGKDATEPVLLNYPHLMFYAPGVSMEDIGARRFADPIYPWVNAPGPHGFIIQAMGSAEKAAINQSYAEMAEALCALKEKWCLE